MTRTRQIPRQEADPSVIPIYDRLFGDRDPVAEPGTDTGTPGDWWTVFAQAPDLMKHMVAGFGLFSSPKRELPATLRELALTRTGFTAGSQFVFSQHCKAARRAGVIDEQLEAIPVWSTSAVFDEAERAVLAYADEMVLADGRVQDATFEALSAHLGEVAVIELTYAIASYRLHALMCRALRLEYDDVDERIVEVAAPDGGDTDVMGTISMRDTAES
ncbi:MAG: carboxymuconolactone decarboxylase family protein [Actinomycetia bacterium]|nr:carboxymuconolactone decarboxylase family protein [Actinomycetes bacterium]MCP5035588.1 carboxymuconolactone decarboxylase family protein [Actinomycetes bacterium]